MPPWLSQLIYLQQSESESYLSKLIQLATVSHDNKPRVRTVVFRGWSNSFDMKICTDKRSSKIIELKDNNNVEACWFLPNSNCQFRFRGTTKIDCDKETWDLLDEKSKSMWSWPSPGNKFEPNNNLNFLPNKETNPIDNYVLLKINIDYVDQLILDKPVHFRRRWIKKREWIEERINP